VDGVRSALDADLLQGLTPQQVAALASGVNGFQRIGSLRVRGTGSNRPQNVDREILVNGAGAINFPNNDGLALVVVSRADYSVLGPVNNVSVRRNFNVNDAQNGLNQWASFIDAVGQLDYALHFVVVASRGPINRFINSSVNNGPTPAQVLQNLGASPNVITLTPTDAFALVGLPDVGATNGLELVVDSANATHPTAELAVMLADGVIVGNETEETFGARYAPFEGSLILNPTQQLKLNDWLGKPYQRWEVCYRRSQHGIGSTAEFFSRCRNRGPSVTVIQTANRTLGGYTENSWSDSYGYRGFDSAFLFLFNGDTAERFWQGYNYEGSTYSHTNGFIRFGQGHDLDIRANGQLYCNFPYTFGAPCNNYAVQTPTDQCTQLLCGANRNMPVNVTETEVWVMPRN
jgi:hypothetical protein